MVSRGGRRWRVEVRGWRIEGGRWTAGAAARKQFQLDASLEGLNVNRTGSQPGAEKRIKVLQRNRN